MGKENKKHKGKQNPIVSSFNTKKEKSPNLENF
jgi:hypothetical protein